ncbi:SDR family oxidoreductase [Novosphingobium pentaromativorans]|uniref:Short chain dehydrogenase family protein n=1 Tax=Novosphingobium pentaromativorans US6-1 TaxID=1088721 RepID=G6ECG0_9SPHN|nr:NAD(P)-dependent oxidoreductase [Novosphingobium pentaromativorans]AIT80064.1 short-chain dehydrogenase [Novosphingobium pentaromativorans US6-1]EHJ61095.1 short chain dehydrogenase family protein [Novosphingobium pentaromativorans US6-1]
MSLTGKTVFISGGSRGIGLAIAKRAAADGANIVVAAKTAEPHRYLPGTIHSAAEEIEAAGGKALPLVLDVRDPDAIEAAMARAADRFGGIDIVINNASAIFKTPVEETEVKRYDLMMDVNVRGTFFTSKAAAPYLLKSGNPHVLTMAPPINLDPKWFAGHVAYTMSKYGMAMTVLGMAEEFRGAGIAFNALWPRYGIATAAIEYAAADAEALRHCRTPEIMADAAYAILNRPSRECTGNFFIDDTLLASEGVTDFSPYRIDPAVPLREGMFLIESNAPPPGA